MILKGRDYKVPERRPARIPIIILVRVKSVKIFDIFKVRYMDSSQVRGQQNVQFVCLFF